MRIHWHRRDLRATDNAGLAGEEPVVPAFVFDEGVLRHGSPPRVAYLLDALAELRDWYRDRGGDLHVARGDPSAVLPALAAEHGADRVSFAEDYSGLAAERDEAVTAALEDAGVGVDRHHDAIHHEPGSITTNAGDPYSVYSYFWKKWRDRPKAEPYDPPGGSVVDAPGEPLPTLSDLGFDEPDADVEPGGMTPARERLAAFCGVTVDGDGATGGGNGDGDDDGGTDAPIYGYEERRDYPAAGATSRLSAHLKWGTVGVRTVYAATARAMERAATEADRESVEAFQGELAWREFYAHVLAFNPEVVTENYSEYEEGIDWRDDPAELAAWRAGETGYPIVDAGMRQLKREAWMHNRLRMIVASFLTKDLLCDWRHGYEHFRRHLVDHDTANDNGGWQWAASTGTDAQPYFRIFNPMTQGERYDPDAEYIHEHVPELREVPPDAIHAWDELSPERRRELAPDYPDPIVDHGDRREAALAMFKRARGEDPDG